jgi:hypothetical protein
VNEHSMLTRRSLWWILLFVYTTKVFGGSLASTKQWATS